MYVCTTYIYTTGVWAENESNISLVTVFKFVFFLQLYLISIPQLFNGVKSLHKKFAEVFMLCPM
jgi:hypothetical protein